MFNPEFLFTKMPFWHFAVFSLLCWCGSIECAHCANYDKLNQQMTITNLNAKTDVFLSSNKTYSIEIIENPNRTSEPFAEDWLVLNIYEENGRIAASKEFYSSYGMFRLDIIDLDGDGSKEFVFHLGTGRGTSTRKETLVIEHLTHGEFVEIVSTPLSGYYGPGKRWWYSVLYADDKGSGTCDAILILQIDDKDLAANPPHVLVPSEKTKVFRWPKVGMGVKKDFEMVNTNVPLGRPK